MSARCDDCNAPWRICLRVTCVALHIYTRDVQRKKPAFEPCPGRRSSRDGYCVAQGILQGPILTVHLGPCIACSKAISKERLRRVHSCSSQLVACGRALGWALRGEHSLGEPSRVSGRFSATPTKGGELITRNVIISPFCGARFLRASMANVAN